MRNLWLVAKHEYLNVIRKKSFLLGTFGMPVLIAVITAVSIIIAVGQRGNLPLGYVDQAGVLNAVPAPLPGDARDFVALRAFDTAADARAALDGKALQGYFVIPEDYTRTGRVELFYHHKRPGEVARSDFIDFLQLNLIADLPTDIQLRVQEGSLLTVRAADGSREFDDEDPFAFLLPYVSAFFFTIAVVSFEGYMLQAVTNEKENRTIEILATSLRPLELIGGKSLGLISVGLTQLIIWVGTVLLALIVAGWFIADMTPLTMPWSLLSVTVPLSQKPVT